MRQGGFHGTPVGALRGMTQGGLAYPTFFNVVVDIVIRHWLSLNIDNPAATHNCVGEEVGQKMGVFHADNYMKGYYHPELLQGSINVLICLFKKIIPKSNIAKSKTMIIQPGGIWYSISVELFTRRSTGEGANYGDCLRRRIPCPEFDVEVTAGALMDHCIQMHANKPEIDWDSLSIS